MHPALWKEIVNECLVYEAGGDCAPLPDFSKEMLVLCIIHLWRLLKNKDKAAIDNASGLGYTIFTG